MVFGGLFAIFDSKWFSIDLGKVVFRVPLTNVRRKNHKFERGSRHSVNENGERIIVPSTLVTASQKWKRSTPYKIRFFGLCCQCLGSREKRRERLYEQKSSKLLDDWLDIRTLIRTQLFNDFAFKFLLKRHEQRYLQVLSKQKRLIDTSGESKNESDNHRQQT